MALDRGFAGLLPAGMYAAAVYNLAWSSVSVLFPSALFQLVGMAAPSYLPLWQVVGMLVLVYAPAYWWAARESGGWLPLLRGE